MMKDLIQKVKELNKLLEQLENNINHWMDINSDKTFFLTGRGLSPS